MTTYDSALGRTAPPAIPHYDRVQRALHWTMAAVILTAMLIGLYCAYQVPGTPVRKFLLEWHKSLGMTALVLAVLRVGWRAAHAAPAYVERLGRLNHAAASAGHLALYGLMLFMPLTGYLTSGAGGNTLPFFWLFQWPRLVPLDKTLAHTAADLHEYGAWAIYAVVGAHLAAVAWHQLIRRDTVLRRMLPRRGTVERPSHLP